MDKKVTTPARTCFLSVPAGADVSVIRRSLERRGIEYTRRDRLDWSTTLETLADLLRGCDFVCSFSRETLPPNVVFELGVAIGMGKPIFLVAAEPGSMPSDLRSINFIRAREWNESIIEPHLDAFLNTLPKKHVRGRSAKVRSGRKVDFGFERGQLAGFRREGEPREFERFVESLFRKAGMSVTASPIQDYGADFAVVSPQIKRRYMDPILVEVKYGPLQADLQFVLRKLAELVERGRGSAGLLVTLEPLAPSWRAFRTNSPRQVPIYAVSAKELIDGLESGGFLGEVWAERNRNLGHEA